MLYDDRLRRSVTGAATSTGARYLDSPSRGVNYGSAGGG
jgi:hypothetical protein